MTPDYARLSGPVLGLFAEKDGFVTPDTARGVEAAIRKAGKPVDIHVYPGVDHAFFNDDNPGAYSARPPPRMPGGAPSPISGAI